MAQRTPLKVLMTTRDINTEFLTRLDEKTINSLSGVASSTGTRELDKMKEKLRLDLMRSIVSNPTVAGTATNPIDYPNSFFPGTASIGDAKTTKQLLALVKTPIDQKLADIMADIESDEPAPKVTPAPFDKLVARPDLYAYFPAGTQEKLQKLREYKTACDCYDLFTKDKNKIAILLKNQKTFFYGPALQVLTHLQNNAQKAQDAVTVQLIQSVQPPSYYQMMTGYVKRFLKF